MGVFGPSGSGKTTLLKVAAGVLATDSGLVSYEGQQLSMMSSDERQRIRRREISCLWSSQPVQGRADVLEDVRLPLLVDGQDWRLADRRAKDALVVCGAENCAGMEMHELSDGERQRVALARALVTGPRLLLADGPAANLSLIEQDEIMALLSSIAREENRAVLVTDVDAEALARAEPILYLREGKLVTPEPISERGQLYQFPSGPTRRASRDA